MCDALNLGGAAIHKQLSTGHEATVLRRKEYDRSGDLNAVGFGFSIELPIHDRNQGNIAHSRVAMLQAADSPNELRALRRSSLIVAGQAIPRNRQTPGESY